MGDISIRCSSLPLARLCEASVLDEGTRIDPPQEAADLGTAAHKALAVLARTGEVDTARLPSLADHYDINLDDLRILVAQGAALWRQVRPLFAGPVLTEYSMSAEIAPGVRLTGTADVVGTDADGCPIILDWKTGRADMDHGEQLRGYMYLALDRDPTAMRATSYLGWVREGDVERHAMTRAESETWAADLADRLLRWDGRTYRPGSHCAHCPRSWECIAGRALMRRDVEAVSGIEPPDVALMAPADVLALYAMARQVRDRAEGAIAAVRERLNGGPVEHEGARLELVPDPKRELDTLAAWPVLEGAFSEPEQWAVAVKLAVGGVERAIKMTAPERGGAAAVRALFAALDAAGAVSMKPGEKIKETKPRA